MDSRKEILDPANSVSSVSDLNIDSISTVDTRHFFHILITILREEEEQERTCLSRNNHDSATSVTYFDSEYSDLDEDDYDDDDDDDYSPLYHDNDDDDDIYNDPASEEAIESMTKMKYEKRASHVKAEEDEEVVEEEDDILCVVCQEALEQGEQVRLMPCCHIFHDLCIVPWLRRRRSCPQCRYQILYNPSPTLDYQTSPYPSPIFNIDPSSFHCYNLQVYHRVWEEHYWGWEEHRLVQEEELLISTPPCLPDLSWDPLFFHANHECSSRPVLTRHLLACVTSDYDVSQILTQGPFNAHWFKLMIAVEAYARKKHRRSFLVLVSASRQRRRRKGVGSNESWNPKMIFRSNAIVKPKGKFYYS